MRAISELAALKNRLGEKGFEVLGVNLDRAADHADAAAAAEAAGWPWRNIRCPEGWLGTAAAEEYRVRKAPTMVLVGEDGKVRECDAGCKTIQEWMQSRATR